MTIPPMVVQQVTQTEELQQSTTVKEDQGHVDLLTENEMVNNKENENNKEIELAKLSDTTPPLSSIENMPKTPSIKVHNEDNILELLPTPFKKALFWPAPKKNVGNTKRKIREKIPAVASSSQWQEYDKNKEAVKNKQEEEKNIKKEERIRKKSEKIK
ncbi:unnamed protein product [Psylliodes chrysocephalus]|uniref:Uncharacterized protein n=1 Tax=Psylliodes chrysocephalus TaxID=3402493 RepID=A0A9P0CQP7_9CUCU|nr:unnamed protein product [Psylliodes chrysocephala]